jgi:MoaA/NifB/PqqE/SkfB family radical SAM enzyme
MAALETLDQLKRERMAHGEGCYTFGIDFTVTRSNQGELERFIQDVTGRFPRLGSVRFGAVIPEGLAQEKSFEKSELLTDEELVALGAAEPWLRSLARNEAHVSVTDVRSFLPYSPQGAAGLTVAHIEADGQLRALSIFAAKVGNLLQEPLEVLWGRALAWRNEPFVVEQLASIRTLRGWARVSRVLDRLHGSEEDKARIARRGQPPPPPAVTAEHVLSH